MATFISRPMSLMVQLSTLFTKNVRITHLTSQIHTQASPLLFQATNQLCAEPMKKKKRIDPNILAARTQKKLKRIDKEIKRLTRFGRILKPVLEIEGDRRKLMAQEERIRESPVLSFEESEWRAGQHKEWARYRRNQFYDSVRRAAKLQAAQEEALLELKNESEELYLAAIQKDPSLLPLQFDGPKETPPIQDYAVPDGEYVDTSRKY